MSGPLRAGLSVTEGTCLRRLVEIAEQAAWAGIPLERLDSFIAVARRSYRAAWSANAGPSPPEPGNG